MTRMIAGRFNIPKPNQKIDSVPGDYGIPILGHTLKFLLNPRGSVKEIYEKYGEVSKVSIFYNKAIVFLGPDATQEILRDTNSNFSAKLAWAEFFGDLAVRSLTMMDFDEHKLNRRLMQSAFKKQAINSYLPNMTRVMEEDSRHWADLENPKAFPLIKEMLLNTAAEVFLGLDIKKDVAQVNEHFVNILNSSVAIVRFPFPGNKMWKALRGKAFLIDFFSKIEKEKRANPGTDMFSRMCEAKDEDGNTLSNEDIVDHMLFMLIAAHDTNTATATNMLYAMAKHPEWQEKMRQEVLAIDSDTMTYDDLNKMPSTELVFKETLRLYAPLPVIPRRSINECTVRGVTVPANTMIWVIPDFCHFMEEYWSAPDTFDPMRFAPPREEHKKHAFAWHPFGGGAHMCMGMHFADMQIKLIMHNLLRKYRFSLPENHNSSYQFFPIPKPKDDLPICIERI